MLYVFETIPRKIGKKNIPAKSSLVPCKKSRFFIGKKNCYFFLSRVPLKNRLFLHGIKDDFAGIFFLTNKVLGGPVTFQVKNHLELPGRIS